MKIIHTHKYMRVSFGGTRVERNEEGRRVLIKKPAYEVFKCQHPGCNSFMPRELVIGNISRCWNCDAELVLDMENTKLKKPTHILCRKIRVA